MEHAAQRARHVLAMRGGGPVMTAALRVTAAAGATTGKVLPSGKVNQWSGTLPSQTQRARAEAAGISVRTQRLLDRLAKVRPDLLDEVRAGRLSAHRAALEAGIIGMTTGDARAGGPDGDRPPWQAVREALDRLAGCPLPAERLAADIPLHRVAGMARNARKASELLADLASLLGERAAALAALKRTMPEVGG
jgi:hypothetical protein